MKIISILVAVFFSCSSIALAAETTDLAEEFPLTLELCPDGQDWCWQCEYVEECKVTGLDMACASVTVIGEPANFVDKCISRMVFCYKCQ